MPWQVRPPVRGSGSTRRVGRSGPSASHARLMPRTRPGRPVRRDTEECGPDGRGPAPLGRAAGPGLFVPVRSYGVGDADGDGVTASAGLPGRGSKARASQAMESSPVPSAVSELRETLGVPWNS